LKRSNRVDQHIRGPDVARDAFEERFNRVRISGVYCFADDADGEILHAQLGPIDRHDVHASVSERNGCNVAERACCAYDNRHAARSEFFVRHSFLLSFLIP
jgi:hypothetical protein